MAAVQAGIYSDNLGLGESAHHSSFSHSSFQPSLAYLGLTLNDRSPALKSENTAWLIPSMLAEASSFLRRPVRAEVHSPSKCIRHPFANCRLSSPIK